MDETFKTFDRVLSIVGISIFATHNWDYKGWLMLQTFNVIIGVLCFICTTGFVVFKFSDILIWIEGASIWNTAIMMSISLGVCLVFRRKFRNFLKEMVFIDAMLEMPFIQHLVLVSPDTPKLMELRGMVLDSQRKLMKYIRILLKTYMACVFVSASLYLCMPMYRMIVREDDDLRLLAFEMWFPWSLQNMTVYTFTLIFNIYCGFLCCIAYPGLQSIIILFVGQIIRQLRILSFILLHLNELVLEITGTQDDRWQAYCTAVLSQCVVHYVKIKRFSNRLNVICQPFYLALILVAIMLVCVCSVKVAISNKFSLDTMKYYFHELCFIIVVLSFCLLGQQVDNECEVLEKVVTEKWYIFDKNHKRNVHIFLMALNQRMPIYIFGTIPLSLTTFTWFIKTGMSFFTLMMSVLEEQENI